MRCFHQEDAAIDLTDEQWALLEPLIGELPRRTDRRQRRTRRGKGAKLMAVAGRFGRPLAMCAASATPHDVTHAPTLDSRFVHELPQRLIGDRAYDADGLDLALAGWGVEMIAPHRRGRVRSQTQDGRPLPRYRRRWKIRRLFAWLGNCRRLVARYERHALNYLGFVHLGCILILLRQSR